jgi:tRNA-2-methylthio-N6-dimethylallyladenosine synthase
MAASPKICRYLHLPAQSGSDRILGAMNRHYTAAHYLELVERARAAVPEIAVAGDFIVGFPGETEEDFHATVDLARRTRYKNCFVFKYSPRPGTTADNRLADTVPDQVKQRRNVELLAVQEQVSGELNQVFLGREVTVLVEGPSKKAHANPADDAGFPQLVARTSTDHIVVFHGPLSLAGRLAQVRITRVAPLTLFGEFANHQ